MIALRYERMPSKKKSEPQFIRMSSNSFVCLLPQKKSEPQFIRMSSNSFVSLPPQKKAEPQFIVCIPMHSYVFQFIRMSSEKN